MTPPPNITIDGLRIHLPANHHVRSESLARLVAEQLALVPWSAPVERERLELRGLQLPVGGSERELAAVISKAIVSALGGQHG